MRFGVFPLLIKQPIRFGGVDWRSVVKNIAILIAPTASAMVAVVFAVHDNLEVPSMPLMSTFLLQVGIGAVVCCSIFLLLARWTGRVKLARQAELSS
ncbi:UNVERIFIED_ORG: hypothetical protein J2W85_002422 [Ensifer adhaerens]|nr:hypothetical protein [Ensifer adhaerens]